MSKGRDPNEIGVIWITPGRGQYQQQMFFSGKVFHIPSDGINVRLVPFSYVDRQTDTERSGIRVTKIPEGA